MRLYATAEACSTGCDILPLRHCCAHSLLCDLVSPFPLATCNAFSSEETVLDDTSCFRWLRQRYREFAHRNSYMAQVVYLDASLDEIRRRMVENATSPQRRVIFDEHVRTFEKPSADEEAIVLDSPETISNWIESKRTRNSELSQSSTELSWNIGKVN